MMLNKPLFVICDLSKFLIILSIILIFFGSCSDDVDEDLELSGSDSSSASNPVTETLIATQDGAVQQINPTSNFDDDGSPCCELRIDGTTMVAFVTYDVSALAGKTITDAKMSFLTESYHTGPKTLLIRLMDVAYDETTVTWNSIGAAVPGTVAGSPTNSSVVLSTSSSTFEADVTDLLQYYAVNSGTITGFLLYAASGQSFIDSQDTDNSTTGPSITVTYF